MTWQPGCAGVRDRLDEAWFLDVAANERVDRLVARHQSYRESV